MEATYHERMPAKSAISYLWCLFAAWWQLARGTELTLDRGTQCEDEYIKFVAGQPPLPREWCEESARKIAEALA